MRLLLDTHVAVWSVSAPRRLSKTTVDLILEPANSVAVSVASLWEVAIKNNLGRPPRDPIGLSVEQARYAFLEADFAILSIEHAHLSAAEKLAVLHGDPFDRLLVATALADTYRLVTHDRKLAAYGDHVLVV